MKPTAIPAVATASEEMDAGTRARVFVFFFSDSATSLLVVSAFLAMLAPAGINQSLSVLSKIITLGSLVLLTAEQAKAAHQNPIVPERR